MTASTSVQLIGSGLLVVSLMFAAGLQLRVADLLALRERPRELSLAVLVNVALIPGLSWVLIATLGLAPEIMLGLMLCIAAPGGPAAVLYVNLARADLALAVSLTIVLPLLGVLTTPLSLALLPDLPAGLRIPALPILLSLIGFALVPLVLGMLILARRAALADRLAPYAKTTANLTLGLLVVVMMILKGEVLRTIAGRTWLAMFGAGALALALGYLAALPGRDSARTGAIVAISRNISVSLMLASTFFTAPVIVATVLSFGLVAFVIPLLLALVWRRCAPG